MAGSYGTRLVALFLQLLHKKDGYSDRYAFFCGRRITEFLFYRNILSKIFCNRVAWTRSKRR